MTEKIDLSATIAAHIDEHGVVILTDKHTAVHLNAPEAFNLLQFLTDHRDILWRSTQQKAEDSHE